jgi:hypothetical protein
LAACRCVGAIVPLMLSVDSRVTQAWSSCDAVSLVLTGGAYSTLLLHAYLEESKGVAALLIVLRLMVQSFISHHMSTNMLSRGILHERHVLIDIGGSINMAAFSSTTHHDLNNNTASI